MSDQSQKLFSSASVLVLFLLGAASVEADLDVYGPTVVGTYSNDSSQVNGDFQAAVSAFDATVLTFAETSTGAEDRLKVPFGDAARVGGGRERVFAAFVD